MLPPGLKRTSSTSSARSTHSSSSTMSSSLSSSSSANKSVTFGPLQTHRVEEIDMEYHQDVYYTGVELKEIRRAEVIAIKTAMKELGHNDFESVEGLALTWRGIEDYRNGVNKVHKTRYHSMEVLKEWKRQEEGGYSDANALRVVSKHLSREDKRTALQYAAEDAAFVGKPVKRSSTALLMGGLGRRRGSLRKSLNSGLNLLLGRSMSPASRPAPRPVSNTAA